MSKSQKSCAFRPEIDCFSVESKEDLAKRYVNEINERIDRVKKQFEGVTNVSTSRCVVLIPDIKDPDIRASIKQRSGVIPKMAANGCCQKIDSVDK